MSCFGENLRKIRNENGLTQEALADLLGTTKQVISRYENNQRSPKISFVAACAEKLGVSIDELTMLHKDGKFIFFFPEDDTVPDTSGTSSTECSPETEQVPAVSKIDFAILGAIRDWSDDDKLDVLEYIQFKDARNNRAEKKP